MNRSEDSRQTLPKSYLNSFVVRITLLFSCIALLTVIGLSLAPRQHGFSYGDSFKLIAELDRVLVAKSLTLFSFILLIILCGIIIFSIAYSHRVAGPLHKLGMHSRKIAAGDLSEAVRLRRDDVIHVLAADLNNLSGRYRDHLVHLQAKTRELSMALERAGNQAPSKDHPGPIDEISERIDEIRELINQIKL
jgi:methyl-accepting chemotaxis protein